MRILVLTSSYPKAEGDFSGRFVEDFVVRLSRFYEVEVLTLPSYGVDSLQILSGITVRRCNYLYPNSMQCLDAAADLPTLFDSSLSAKLQIPALLAALFCKAVELGRRADLICSHWFVPCGLVAALACRFLRIPHLLIEHSAGLHLLRRSFPGRVLLRAISRATDKVVFVSNELLGRFKSIVQNLDATVIPMGVDCSSFAVPIRRKVGKKVLFLGRIARVKGLDVLVEALAGLEGFELTVAGDGPERSKIEAKCRWASFLGSVEADKRRELLAENDIVVIPSRRLKDGRSEGLPVVCLEAMAAGRIVVAARVGGLQEVIRHAVNGFLFEPENSLALRKLLAELPGKDLTDVAINAVSTAASYDWEVIIARYVRLIKSVLRDE
ncbi:MAG: glycosyltransferase family 4 protein [Acidobacteriota bacterium]|nr:glycosyltransferase family 4 protein [Blastocatellia bacterium]MDW8412473.1 glycosyltransferase family 4 protein [Acidobacteriota bacterium]